MVNFYKHDIPAWMDGTENLSDGAYRAYHVICQLIYLNEGPIAVNKRGFAGRCNQRLEDFNRYFKELTEGDRPKLCLEDGKIGNPRATSELKKIVENRVNAGKGGRVAGRGRLGAASVSLGGGLPAATASLDGGHGAASDQQADNILKNNDAGGAPLNNNRSLKEKRREEKTREERIDDVVLGGELQQPDDPPPQIAANDLITRLVDAAQGNVAHGAPGIEITKPIHDLISMGCDLDIDILPTIAKHVPPMDEPLRMWGAAWLRDRILAARQKRLDGRGKAKPASPATETEDARTARWNTRCDFWFRSNLRMWPDGWGPRPDSAACEIPKDFVERYRVANGFDEYGRKIPATAAG